MACCFVCFPDFTPRCGQIIRIHCSRALGGTDGRSRLAFTRSASRCKLRGPCDCLFLNYWCLLLEEPCTISSRLCSCAIASYRLGSTAAYLQVDILFVVIHFCRAAGTKPAKMLCSTVLSSTTSAIGHAMMMKITASSSSANYCHLLGILTTASSLPAGLWLDRRWTTYLRLILVRCRRRVGCCAR
jgi:hypothetical protein